MVTDGHQERHVAAQAERVDGLQCAYIIVSMVTVSSTCDFVVSYSHPVFEVNFYAVLMKLGQTTESCWGPPVCVLRVSNWVC